MTWTLSRASVGMRSMSIVFRRCRRLLSLFIISFLLCTIIFFVVAVFGLLVSSPHIFFNAFSFLVTVVHVFVFVGWAGEGHSGSFVSLYRYSGLCLAVVALCWYCCSL